MPVSIRTFFAKSIHGAPATNVTRIGVFESIVFRRFDATDFPAAVKTLRRTDAFVNNRTTPSTNHGHDRVNAETFVTSGSARTNIVDNNRLAKNGHLTDPIHHPNSSAISITNRVISLLRGTFDLPRLSNVIPSLSSAFGHMLTLEAFQYLAFNDSKNRSFCKSNILDE